jgi:micrococcal nuclease
VKLRAVALSLLAAALGGTAVYVESGGNPEAGEALVVRVVDGDTVDVGRGFRKTRVRLIGVDTPEIGRGGRPDEPFALEASAWARSTLAGRRVRLQQDPPRTRDRYGRLLAYVVLEDGTCANAELVRLGLGRVLRRFRFARRAEFDALEAEARAARRGIWSDPLAETPRRREHRGRGGAR